jgi:hypothetical protein
MNTTSPEAPSPFPQQPHKDAGWSYTIDASEIRRLRAESEAKGKNRHAIMRDTPILEGISEGTYGKEAIVVDYNDSPEVYEDALREVLELSQEDGKVDKSKILNAVFDTVSERMPYSLSGVDKIFKYVGGIDNTKVGLSSYIDAKIGVCRHQALFVGVLLELLRKEGVVRGTVSFDRNINWKQDGEPGGHAWARYTNSAGEVFILDPAQKFLGSLEESVKNNLTKGHGWDYARPEEREQLRNKVLGRNSVTGMIEVPDWVNGK